MAGAQWSHPGQSQHKIQVVHSRGHCVITIKKEFHQDLIVTLSGGTEADKGEGSDLEPSVGEVESQISSMGLASPLSTCFCSLPP